eukprot:CAMPEP_0115305260 /NCGR_PEP_ID=MMETSP0270-20121206/71929_1 /TAXON_ID=71861 /ORGANISM="Scrippsiella trochoidea, Strain CCMP3099" /LENGTH=43 /DNA_ID= /DNA_START= /DNA_END= /DNA_ORIENTATION=
MTPPPSPPPSLPLSGGLIMRPSACVCGFLPALSPALVAAEELP